MNFSGAVKITDLDDFIAPAQECIKTSLIKGTPESKHEEEKTQGAAAIRLSLEHDPGSASFYQVKETQDKKAKITLDDCLACVGCLTSAETILVEQQGTSSLLEQLRTESNRLIVVTLSPQSCASLAHQYRLSLLSATRKIASFFYSLGAKFVLDASCGIDISLLECKREFVRRYKSASQPMPILASECPGWVCYAEKTQPHLLPHMSRVKSPQQVLGTVVKSVIAERLGVADRPSDIFHVCVMPCFDKKLEGSRKDFFNEELDSKDVDLVLATNEVQRLLQEQEIDLSTLPEHDLEDDFFNVSASGALMRAPDSGASGGYLENVFRFAAKELFDVEVKGPLLYKSGRNPDLKETELLVKGVVKLRFAYVYGFRNIQNLVRKMKRGVCRYDYVEVMACPGGCLNGGGQIRLEQRTPSKQRELVQTLDKIYHEAEEIHSSSSFARTIYSKLIQVDSAAEREEQIEKLFYYDFRAVKQNPDSLATKW